MDKQIMDQNKFIKGKDDFIDLVNHRCGGGGETTDETLPNYDFQPIRPHASLQHSNFDSTNAAEITTKSSVDSKSNSGNTDYGFIELMELANFKLKKNSVINKAALISEIDKTMKTLNDNLVNVLEGASPLLSQLENKSGELEKSIDDLKASFAKNDGNSDEKLRQIEHILHEVQAGPLMTDGIENQGPRPWFGR